MKAIYSLRLITSVITTLLLSCGVSRAAEVASNLGEPGSASLTFSGNNWLASSFTTDGFSYVLNSVTLPLDSPFAENITVTLRVFSDASGAPTSSALETFAPLSFSSGGDKTFNSTGLTLAPNTTYWLTASGDGFIPVWFATDSTAQTGNWTIGDNGLGSSDSGASWPISSDNIGKFSVEATAVPEPTSFALIALLAACYAARRHCRAGRRD